MTFKHWFVSITLIIFSIIGGFIFGAAYKRSQRKAPEAPHIKNVICESDFESDNAHALFEDDRYEPCGVIAVGGWGSKICFCKDTNNKKEEKEL